MKKLIKFFQLSLLFLFVAFPGLSPGQTTKADKPGELVVLGQTQFFAFAMAIELSGGIKKPP